MRKYAYKRTLPVKITVFLVVFCGWNASAQMVPLAAQYYENQYLGNPAFVGMKAGVVNVNLGYRNQWKVIPGSPVTQSLTGDYRFDKKGMERVGLGLNVYSDKAGLIKRTRIMSSYAYHLPLNAENQEIHFGLSFGIMNERLDMEAIIADPNDVLADQFNQRSTYLDGDFGIVYINNKLTVQGAVPNLKKLLKKDIAVSVESSTFFMAFSYKIGANPDVVSVEPKFCFRGASDINNIWDAGAEIKFSNNALSLMGMYHSSHSSTVGLSVNYLDKVIIQGFYTSQLAAQREATGGSFEINLKVPIKLGDGIKNPKF